METKTHYRKVFKSDHLGVADLEDYIEEKRSLIFTIKEVKQYTIESDNKNSGIVVAGKRISCNIAYFENQSVKPLVLNATNSRIIKAFNHNIPFVEDWANTAVELYIDPKVKLMGEITGGVRIRSVQPILKKPDLTPSHARWDEIVGRLKDGVPIDNVEQHYDISKANRDKLLEAAL